LSTQKRQTFFLTWNRFLWGPPGRESRGLPPSDDRGPEGRNPDGRDDDGDDGLGEDGPGADGVFSVVSAMEVLLVKWLWCLSCRVPRTV
jgi:hypothetical protein